jgi:outer membrane lipoprotein-sorting protein
MRVRPEMPMTRMLATALIVLAASVASAANEAREILDHWRQLDETTRHWTDLHQKLTLHVFYRGGGSQENQLEVFEKRSPDKERKTVMFVLAPAEAKGTGFLALVHPGRPPEQWLYLPDIKRVRQIAATMRDESFIGSDLTYRDMNVLAEMLSWTEDDATAALRADETLDGTACRQIELTPKREEIGYKRIVLWLGKDDFTPRKLELYDDGPEPRKRIREADVRVVGAIPVPYKTTIETPRTGSHTEVTVDEVKFDEGLKDDLFTQRQLERGGR